MLELLKRIVRPWWFWTLLLACYQLPSAVYLASGLGFFDKLISERTGVRVTLERGWGIAVHDIGQVILGNHANSVTFAQWSPLNPWGSDELLQIDRLTPALRELDINEQKGLRAVAYRWGAGFELDHDSASNMIVTYVPDLKVTLTATPPKALNSIVSIERDQ